jgi:hypothetical protein
LKIILNVFAEFDGDEELSPNRWGMRYGKIMSQNKNKNIDNAA